MKKNVLLRRDFLKTSSLLSAAFLFNKGASLFADEKRNIPRFGLCTYVWGQSMDLPTLLNCCIDTGLTGLELRTMHKHGVELSLSSIARGEVKKRFADSPVTFVGLGTNEDFHSPDPDRVRKSIETAKAYIKLSYDCGGQGVKVKPNDLPKGVDRAKTTAQIADALHELAIFAKDYDQQIRLENHGGCAAIPIMKEIIEQVPDENVGLCWNCNPIDTKDLGITDNFRSVQNRLADTVHLHEFELDAYPYDVLLPLFYGINYKGWFLFECNRSTNDPVQGLIDLRKKYTEIYK